jgi:hypothetical protein
LLNLPRFYVGLVLEALVRGNDIEICICTGLAFIFVVVESTIEYPLPEIRIDLQ